MTEKSDALREAPKGAASAGPFLKIELDWETAVRIAVLLTVAKDLKSVDQGVAHSTSASYEKALQEAFRTQALRMIKIIPEEPPDGK